MPVERIKHLRYSQTSHDAANPPLHIVLADDHPVVLLGARMALSSMPNSENFVIHEASTPQALIHLLERTHCDLLITDYCMPAGEAPDGMALISYIRRHFQHIKIIVATMITSPLILKHLLKLNISGLFDKHRPLQELKNAVSSAFKGKHYVSASFSALLTPSQKGDITDQTLSNKEIEVVRLFGQDLAGREIAKRLNRSEKTISRQKRTAMQKLGIRHNTELAHIGRSYS